MNDRLDYLRIDAGLARLQDGYRLVAITKGGSLRDPLDGLEEFARLVIEECINQINETAGDILNGDIFRDDHLQQRLQKQPEVFGLLLAVERIRERFE